MCRTVVEVTKSGKFPCRVLLALPEMCLNKLTNLEMYAKRNSAIALPPLLILGITRGLISLWLYKENYKLRD
jgi:hypothetical protein